MFIRSSKRRDSVSSEENDYEESYARIQFQVEYPTKPNQTLYMIGNVDELGNWDLNQAVKLIKLDSKTSIWESTLPLECPVGMTIKYKYLIINSNKKKFLEKIERSITTKKPGQYIIMNKRGDKSAKITFVDKEKRSQKRKMSRINLDILNMNDSKNTSENENDLKNLKFSFGRQEDDYSE
jgi:hypothetical protein